MLGLLLPLLIGTLGGAWRSRSVAGLERARVAWWPLAVASLAVQLVLFNPPIDRQPWAIDRGPWIWVGCLIAMLAVLVRNGLSRGPERKAWCLAALGVAANLAVVATNSGAMPQSPEARLAVRGRPLILEDAPAQLRNVAPAGPETRLPWLGDVIPQPAWMPAANVVSIGDLLMTIALGWWAYGVFAAGVSANRAQAARRSETTLSTGTLARNGATS